jgi:hypothetical protein
MHSDIIEQIARQRDAEVRRSAESRHIGPADRGPRNPIRHRTGWALVAIGLRIANDSGDV